MSEETLAQILAAMPEEQRFILTLHYVKGLPQKEIAKTLGVDPKVMSAAWNKNVEVRPQRDWEKLVGRAISKKSKG